ncbi:MAG: carbohydrate binding family 9 domain-containing protein [Candidatus Handelsmanbacteria bacterium]|nr:carbohydrate binding family 9 domain-containing protein [Candidatus Handelsmanbacteria bacterium]
MPFSRLRSWGAPTALLLLNLLPPAALWATAPRPMEALRLSGISPRIDGVLDEEVWAAAPRFAGFTQREPDEGQPATEETVVQLAYDDQALYLGITAFDQQPEGITARLARRDQWTEADALQVSIDAHHDHQTACFFEINAAGTLRDGVVTNDGQGWNPWDYTWNGVWEAKQSRTAQGWCAEFRIPFHVLRFSPQERYTWGINVTRYLSRRKEKSLWVMVPSQQSGWVSRFAHLEGITAITPARAVEVLPYTVGRSTFAAKDDQFADLGGDLRYSITSGTSLNATLNPDFGQVEADPARLNLSVFEDFQEERRPFFVEGAQNFQTPIQLFYSRRIGRQPGHFGVPDGYEVADQSDFTTILGAAKLTGKTHHQTSFGVLSALSADEYADLDSAYADPLTGGEKTAYRRFLQEPRTHFLVGRVKQDLLKGTSSVGLMATVLDRRLGQDAYSGGTDWRLKWRNNAYEFWGQVAFSQVPDEEGKERRGLANMMVLGKRSGWLRGELWWEAFSKGFEVNDLGFQWRNDYYQSWLWLQTRKDTPWGIFRSNVLEGGRWGMWNFDGVSLEQGMFAESRNQFKNYWWLEVELFHRFRGWDDLDTRGGPVIAQPARTGFQVEISSDNRKALNAFFDGEWGRNSAGSHWSELGAGFTLRPSPRLEFRWRPGCNGYLNKAQWLENVDEDGDGEDDHFVYGELRGRTLDLTTRASLIFSRDLSLELYLQPFISSGDYRNFKELARPKSFEFTPHPAPADNPDFHRRSLQSNAVLRWEYRPGSTLFLVWSQARDHEAEAPRFRPWGDLGRSFTDEGANIFLLKLNYWLRL